MIKLWSKLNVLVNSSCNFLCDKLFHKPEIHIGPGKKNDSSECYGKRLKLSDEGSSVNDVIDQTVSPRMIHMQKSFEISDDEEDECSVIAEIPRRKKPGTLANTNTALPLNEITAKPAKFSTFTFKKDSVAVQDDQKEITQIKVISHSSSKDAFAKSHLKTNRFFNNQRVPLNHGKVMKFRPQFKNYFRRKMNSLQESYRLSEKLQYLQLLQSQISCNLITVKPTFNKITEVSKIPVIDLTEDPSDGSDEEPVVEIQYKPSDDQDIQILREIPSARSFQDILKIKKINSKDAIPAVLPGESNLKWLSLKRLPEDRVTLVDEDDYNEDNHKTSSDALEERLRNYMQITGSTAQEVDSTVEDQYLLPELTPEQEEKITKALVPQPLQEVLAQGFGLKITRRDIQTLTGLNWLNDEVINFYMNLIMERSKNNGRLPRVFAFNTFFYTKLASSGYSSLRRWTKQVDIFSFDLILVPVHLGMHWCLAVIDFRCKSVQYYDSIGSPNNACLERLLMYIKAESLDKKDKVFSTCDWKKANVEDIPQQMNGSDCGVFSCMFAEHLARDCGILFTQDDMPYFRKKMILEILEKKLLT